jgi:molybdopterin-guanine dinucleotide biosynthesis protein A
MSNLIKSCTGVILAGGENRRMPVTKAFIRINGKRIIETNVKIMESLFQDIFIVTMSIPSGAL